MAEAGALDAVLTLDARQLGVMQPRPLATLHVGGAARFDGLITASGGVAPFGSLSVTGALTAGSLAVTGNATVGGTLGVTGGLTAGSLSTGSFGVTVGPSGFNGHTTMSMATGGIAATAGSEGQLELQNANSGAAKIAFHRTGVYAAYFGLDTDNLWCVGGWSMGAARYPLAFTNMAQTLDNKTLSTLAVSDYMIATNGTVDLGNASTYASKVRAVKAWGGAVTVYCTGSNGFVFWQNIVASGALVIAYGDSYTFFSAQGYWWVT